MNPYTPHVDAAAAKIAEDNEREATLKLKHKHISRLRDLLFIEIQAKGEKTALDKEIDKILYQADQRL